MSPPRAEPAKSPAATTMAASLTDAILTIDDLVAYLKLPKSTVYKLAQEGKIPGKKVGKHWRFRRSTINCWLDQRGGR